jgi:hypothetical protein
MAMVPSLEGGLYLTDPQSIIAYIIRKYFRTPKEAVTLLENMIVSLRHRVSLHGGQPDVLTSNIQSDLQGVFDRIFRNERQVTVSCTPELTSSNTYDVTISVIYSLLSGEIGQTGARITLQDGELVIPEDNLTLF